MADWLGERRVEAAADRILDAAETLFTRHGAANVGMNDVATAAGCSRATLYRYFENRDALYTAYVHREAHRVFRELGDRIAGIADPRERLLEAVLAALSSVRESPSLSAWFVTTERPIGGEMARLMKDPGHIDSVLADGADRAAAIAAKTIADVKDIVGLVRH